VPSLSGAHKMVSTHVLGKNWCGYYGVNWPVIFHIVLPNLLFWTNVRPLHRFRWYFPSVSIWTMIKIGLVYEELYNITSYSTDHFSNIIGINSNYI
jgi:hypothetical protein